MRVRFAPLLLAAAARAIVAPSCTSSAPPGPPPGPKTSRSSRQSEPGFGHARDSASQPASAPTPQPTALPAANRDARSTRGGARAAVAFRRIEGATSLRRILELKNSGLRTRSFSARSIETSTIADELEIREAPRRGVSQVVLRRCCDQAGMTVAFFTRDLASHRRSARRMRTRPLA
jgi:hypothetical protein